MPDPVSPDAPDDDVDEPDTPTLPPAAELGDAGKATLAKERAKAREATKALNAAMAELEQLKAQTMSDGDKAIAAARAEAAAETAAKYGTRLATSAIKAAAAGRPINVEALLKSVDASKFLDDDGEPDEAAITEWLDELAPAVPTATDLGQGRRGQTTGEPTAKEIVDQARSRQAWI